MINELKKHLSELSSMETRIITEEGFILHGFPEVFTYSSTRPITVFYLLGYRFAIMKQGSRYRFGVREALSDGRWIILSLVTNMDDVKTLFKLNDILQ